MDISLLPHLYFIVIDFIVVILFVYFLFGRGVRKSRKPLILILGILLVVTTLDLLQVRQYYLNPLGPPPEIWSEWYYDSLYMRSQTNLRTLFEGLLLLILSISYVFANILQSGEDTTSSHH